MFSPSFRLWIIYIALLPAAILRRAARRKTGWTNAKDSV
jgi:hypothetical protein